MGTGNQFCEDPQLPSGTYLADECDSVSPHGFTATEGVHAFAGLGFHTDLIGVQAECLGQFFLHARDMGGKFGAFKAYRRINIHNRITGILQQLADMTKE